MRERVVRNTNSRRGSDSSLAYVLEPRDRPAFVQAAETAVAELGPDSAGPGSIH
jgi:hypothetical protein